jgi:hypothetical protein
MRRVHFKILISLLAAASLAGAADPIDAERTVLFHTDFEEGTGVYDPTQDRYSSLGGNRFESNQKIAALKVESPAGAGNASKYALTCHANKTVAYVDCAAPCFAIGQVEPQGFDGGVSFKISNQGFRRIYVMYVPQIPSSVTFHRCAFDAGNGEWMAHDLKLDLFLYHGRRPRRDCRIKRIVFVGEEPLRDDARFQIDDVCLYRVKQNPPGVPRQKEPLPPDVLYRQDFNDPCDFDLESFYPEISNCNIFRTDYLTDKKTEGGLELQCYEKKCDFWGGRHISFSGACTLEFDCLVWGCSDFAIVGRSDTERMRWYPAQPKPGVWTRISVPVENLTPYSIPSKDGPRLKPARNANFVAFFFRATADDSTQHYILIDNLVIRRPPVEQTAGAEQKD